jgi:uncharacterized protein YjiS (DUF1127 family)
MSQTLTFDRNSTATSHSRLDRPTLWSRLTGLFQRNTERLATIRELQSLNDQMLRDIGVDRDNIEASVDALYSAVDGGRS